MVNNSTPSSDNPSAPVTNLSVADWSRFMAVNLRWPLIYNKAAVPPLNERGYGKINNIGSTPPTWWDYRADSTISPPRAAKFTSNRKTYLLIDTGGQPVANSAERTLNGHRKSNIYGRLDCEGALCWTANSH